VVLLKLLLDTGASFTIIPVEVAERLGCDLSHPLRRVRVAAANGVLIAPVVPVARFECLGTHYRDMPVVATPSRRKPLWTACWAWTFWGGGHLCYICRRGPLLQAHAGSCPLRILLRERANRDMLGEVSKRHET